MNSLSRLLLVIAILKAAERHYSNVIRFPIERTRAKGDL